MKAGARFVLLASTFVSAWTCAQPAMEKPGYVVEYLASAAKNADDRDLQRPIRQVREDGRLTRLLERARRIDSAPRTLKLVAYPLRVGSDWTWKREFPNPAIAETITGKVVAYEAITVPAGAFNCFRVDASGSQTNRHNKLNRKWTHWYCPEVKGYAKMILETQTFNAYNPAATGTSVETYELMKFTPGK